MTARCVTIMVTALIASGMVPGRVAAREIGPKANLCAEINSLAPGQELVLEPGDYQGGCTVRRGGSPGKSLVIRAQDLHHRPRLVFKGRDRNVLNIRAGHIVIRGLEFGPTRPDVDGVRIYQGDDVTVEDCAFSDMGGIAVVANHASVRNLVVRRNVIINSSATAMYFGCHDGLSCKVSGLVVERNYIHGVDAPERAIGYGLEVKLNSTAVIRDNIIIDTKGPGIMVYGAQERSNVSTVERNFTAGSRTSSGIVIGGGPALVRNNVAVSNAEAGISLEDYGRRGLLRDVAVVHNTVYDNGKGGIVVSGGNLSDDAIINNAAHALPGTPAFTLDRPGIRSSGNIDCSFMPCFANPSGKDFSPLPGSVLFSRVESLKDTWIPADDFFGKRRSRLPTIGAIEDGSGPIPMGIKP